MKKPLPSDLGPPYEHTLHCTGLPGRQLRLVLCSTARSGRYVPQDGQNSRGAATSTLKDPAASVSSEKDISLCKSKYSSFRPYLASCCSHGIWLQSEHWMEVSFYNGLCRVLGTNISPTDSSVGSCFSLVSGDCQGVSGILREGIAFTLNNV